MKKLKKTLLTLSALFLISPVLSSCSLIDTIKSWFTTKSYDDENNDDDTDKQEDDDNKDDDGDDDNQNTDEKSITISGETSLHPGETLQLTATLSNCSGTVNWTSSDDTKATVSSTGLVSAKSTITTTTQVTITATLESDTTVTASKVISIVPTTYTSPNTSTINSSNFSISSDYSTGSWSYWSTSSSTTNYNTIDNVTYNFYRGTQTKGSGFICLLPDTSIYKNSNDYKSGLPGALYNTSPISGIDSIEITYTCGSTNSASTITKPKVKFGTTTALSNNEVTLDVSTTETTKELSVVGNGYQYFKIETGSYQLSISKLVINYRNDSTTSATYQAASGSGLYRLNPVTYTDTLVAGESSVTVPVAGSVNSEGKFEVTKTKTLTYYTYDYVSSNTSVASEAALTDPADICAYYNAFKTWPANYVTSKNYTTAYSIFGTNTRQYSSYNKTTGYATAVKWNPATGQSYPQYYELDVDLTGSYASSSSSASRGVGRIVAWHYGFSPDGYDDNPVCVYTDDHYVTFQEYLNNGSFSKRFNATGYATPYTYGAATTVTTTDDVSTVPTTVSVTGVSINKSSATIEVGSSTTLTATVTPSNATNKNVIWTTSDSLVATVSNGTVTGVATGTATITATTEDGNYAVSCTITVNAKQTDDSSIKCTYDFTDYTTSNTQLNITTLNNKKTISSSYSTYTYEITSATNAYTYFADYLGGSLRMASKSNTGSLTFECSSTPSKIEILGTGYSSSELGTITCDSSTSQSFTNCLDSGETLTFNPTSSTFTLNFAKRCLIYKIYIY